MAKTEQFTAQEMIDALTDTKGMITLAAQRLRCSPNTVRRYIREYKTVAEAQRNSRDKMTDAVELKLYEKIMGGDTTAMIFYLKTQGKARGYVERIENWNIDIPPELMHRFAQAVEQMGWSLGDVLEDFVRQANAAEHQRVQSAVDSEQEASQ